MDILFLTSSFYPEINACASRVYERAIYWANKGHTVTILTSTPSEDGKSLLEYKNRWYQKEVVNGINVVRIKTLIVNKKYKFLRILNYLSYLFSAIFFASIVKKADIVVATSPQFFTALAGSIIAFYKRKPYILELSDLWPESIAAVGIFKKGLIFYLLEKIELLLYRHASAIITLTSSFKKDLINRAVPANKITTIINGVELQQFTQNKSSLIFSKYDLNNKFIIGYIGTIGLAQSLENVLHCANILKDTKNIHFIFVGNGVEKEKLMLLAKQLKLNNVTFIKQQPKNQISHYWNMCNIALVHLSNRHAFTKVLPSKILESMAHSLPILLVAPKGEATNFVEKLKIGVCVPPDSPSLLAKKILHIHKETKELSLYATNASNAIANFTREQQAKSMLAIFESVCKQEEEKQCQF